MSLVAFTFGSVGDIITLVQLSAQLVQFLARASFNSRPYCDFILQVNHLNVLLTKLDALLAVSRESSETVPGATETQDRVVLHCRKVLEKIRQRALLYADRLESKGLSWTKIGAMLFQEHELLKFKEELESVNTMIIRSITSMTSDLHMSQHRSARKTESCMSALVSNQKALLQVVQGIDQRIPRAVSQFTRASEFSDLESLHECFGNWWFDTFERHILARQTYRMPTHVFANGNHVCDFLVSMMFGLEHLPRRDQASVATLIQGYEHLERVEREHEEKYKKGFGHREDDDDEGVEDEDHKDDWECEDDEDDEPFARWRLHAVPHIPGIFYRFFGRGYMTFAFQIKNGILSMNYSAYILHPLCDDTRKCIGTEGFLDADLPDYNILNDWTSSLTFSQILDAWRRR